MKTTLFKPLILVLFIAFLSADALDAYAQPVLKNRTRTFLRRTTMVLLATHKVVKANKVYTGNLARAIAHQRYARKLFFRNRFYRAIYHSRRARLLAFSAIKANKKTVPKEWAFQSGDEAHFKDSPSDAELDKALKAEMPDASFSDEQVIKQSLDDIDISDTPPEKYKGR